MDIRKIVLYQQAYYRTGATHSYEARRAALHKLRLILTRHEDALTAALQADLHKSAFESFTTEIGFARGELTYMEKHLREFMRPRRVPSPLLNFPSVSFISPEPYGTALILSPWNYPVNLTFAPLTAALAAGNTAVVSLSGLAQHTSALLRQLFNHYFDPCEVKVITEDDVSFDALLQQPFDCIFFTGSSSMGRRVMKSAAERLTSITLELGGKSPCIVDETANLPLAARRIAFGKCINAGQTCVAPDYLLIHERVQEKFICYYQTAIRRFYGKEPLRSPFLPAIINEKHFHRLSDLMVCGTILTGGRTSADSLQIEPTLLGSVSLHSPLMEQEIFGPLLPVIPFHNLDEAIEQVRSRPKPLALYLFTSDKSTAAQVLHHCSFGGGCINDTVMHLASSTLPFGGVGNSGMGRYHGKAGFDAFTNPRGILLKATWLDLPFRYPPYRTSRLALVKQLMK